MADRKETKAKRTFLKSWARRSPMATIEEAREALRVQFGETMNNGVIAKMIKEARQNVSAHAALADTELTPLEELRTAVDVLNAIVALMKSVGISKIEVHPDGKHTFDVFSSTSA